MPQEKVQTKKDVYLIGNGFDLSLGLPTGYADFIKSDYFTNNISHSKLFEYLHQKSNLSKWVDIEGELVYISREVSNDIKLLHDYKILCRNLCNYIESLDKNKINRNSPAYQLLSKHYRPSVSYIANFNYTNTVQLILNELSIPTEDINCSINHVHGESHRGNIIFGVNDKAAINPDHVFLYKSTLNHDGGRSVKQALKNAERIFFFGHSLGESDHMYLEDLFLKLRVHDKSVELYFYHHGELGFYELHKQLHKLTTNNVSELKSNTIFHTIDTSSSAR